MHSLILYKISRRAWKIWRRSDFFHSPHPTIWSLPSNSRQSFKYTHSAFLLFFLFFLLLLLICYSPIVTSCSLVFSCCSFFSFCAWKEGKSWNCWGPSFREDSSNMLSLISDLISFSLSSASSETISLKPRTLFEKCSLSPILQCLARAETGDGLRGLFTYLWAG